MALGDVTAVIRADGFSADVTVAGRAAWLGATIFDFGSYRIPGVLNGTFTDGEVVTQAVTSATGTVYGAGQGATAPHLVIKLTSATAANTSGVWTGGTSGKTCTPTAIPLGVGTDSDLSWVVTSEGYNGSGTLGTITRTVYGTALMRMPTGTSAITGTLSGTFTDGETVTQATSLATAIVYGAAQGTTHASLIVHTISGTPDDTNTWTGGTSTQTVSAVSGLTPVARTNDERVVGTDIVYRIALSEQVHDDDKNGGAGTSGTNPKLYAAAGWASNGGNNSNAASNVDCTNNSTQDYPAAFGQWDIVAGAMHRSRVKSNFVLAFNARHGFGVAAVRFNAVGGTSAVDTEAYVTTQTGTKRTGTNLYGWAHQTTVTLSAYTQGETITSRARVYPKVGDADSVFDTNGRTTAAEECRGYNDHILICDKSDLLDVIRYIATTGNDTTGDGSIGNPWLTVSKATTTATVNVVYCGPGETNPSFNLGSAATRKTSSEWVVVIPAPTMTGTLTVVATTTKNYRVERLCFRNCTVSRNALSWMDGENVGNYLWFDNCVFSQSDASTPTAGPNYRSHCTYWTNCTGDLCFTEWRLRSVSTDRVADQFDGVAFGTDATAASNIDAWHRIVACTASGNIFAQKATANPAPNQSNGLFEFNRILNCVGGGGGSQALVYGALEATTGLSIIGNVIEKTAGSESALHIHADNTAFAATNFIVSHNTIVGASTPAAAERCNLFYNDTGGTAYNHRSIFVVGNTWRTNIKSDTFGTPNAKRVGNWPQLYGVNWRSNNTTSTDNFEFAYGGMDYTRLAPTYANFAGEDWRQASGSGLLDRVDGNTAQWPHQVPGDQYGYRLSTDATALAAVGALQPVATISVAYDGDAVSDGGTVSEAAGTKSLVITAGGLTGACLYVTDVALAGSVSGTDLSPYSLAAGGTTASATITTTLAAGAGTVDISWDLSSVFDFDITGSSPAGSGGFRSRSRGRGR